MKTIFYSIMLVMLTIGTYRTKAQCIVAQTNVSITVHTDAYGYEGYWELYPLGSSCGNGTLASGGNSVQVGCSGGGQQVATTGNGYGNNQNINAGSWCLDSAASYQIKYVDDYGDGGFSFTVNIDGLPIYEFSGSGANATFNFIATPAPAFDLSVTKIIMNVYVQPGAQNINGDIFNFGSTTVTSFDLNYSVNGGATSTLPVTGVNIPGYTTYNYSIPSGFNPASNGNYNIDVWATNLNGGNADMNLTNDHHAFTVIVGDPIPNIIGSYLLADPIFTTIATSSNQISSPNDLDFYPVLSNYQLWVINKGTESSGGNVVIINNAGKPNQSSTKKTDGKALHFMSLPTAIAFSDNGNFATSSGVLDANHGTGHYTGPTLWDPTVFAVPNSGNGSHIDMIHQSPLSMGLAYDHDNAFWVYNGFYNTLDHYDFQTPHEPGGSDHSDGIVKRYADISLNRIDDNIVNHMVLDKPNHMLYMVNNGSTQIIRMDANTGTTGSNFSLYGESIAGHSIVSGVTQSVVVSTGLLQPSGIDVIGNRMIVSDYSNGDIIIYDISGASGIELGRIHTGFPGIQGVKIGPDGKIWFVNQIENKVMRVDFYPAGISGINDEKNVGLYPNPTKDGIINLDFSGKLTAENLTIHVKDVLGREVLVLNSNANSIVKLDLNNEIGGTYFLNIIGENVNITKSLIIQK